MASAPTSVEALLVLRAQAVRAHDGPGLAATQAAGATEGVRDLGARTADLPLTAWAYTVTSSRAGPVVGQRTVTAELHYRLPADPSDVTALRRLVLVRGPVWRILSDEAVGASLPWDLGPVTWAAGRDSEVVSLLGPADMGADADAAARAVTAVWGTDWRVPVVVEVADSDALAALVGRGSASVAGLVAVSTPDRVYLDLATYRGLDGAGRQVLLIHEMTDVATAAGGDSATPQWLKEGFADYVGFLHSGIGVHTAAAALLTGVRQHGPPSAAPPDADFAPGTSGELLAGAYAGAWLLCTLVAEREGQPALVAVYRATAAGPGTEQADVDAALRRVTGRSLAAWTVDWRQDLVRLAA